MGLLVSRWWSANHRKFGEANPFSQSDFERLLLSISFKMRDRDLSRFYFQLRLGNFGAFLCIAYFQTAG